MRLGVRLGSRPGGRRSMLLDVRRSLCPIPRPTTRHGVRHSCRPILRLCRRPGVRPGVRRIIWSSGCPSLRPRLQPIHRSNHPPSPELFSSAKPPPPQAETHPPLTRVETHPCPTTEITLTPSSPPPPRLPRVANKEQSPTPRHSAFKRGPQGARVHPPSPRARLTDARQTSTLTRTRKIPPAPSSSGSVHDHLLSPTPRHQRRNEFKRRDRIPTYRPYTDMAVANDLLWSSDTELPCSAYLEVALFASNNIIPRKKSPTFRAL